MPDAEDSPIDEGEIEAALAEPSPWQRWHDPGMKRRIGGVLAKLGAAYLMTGTVLGTVLESLFIHPSNPLLAPNLGILRIELLLVGGILLAAGAVLRRADPAPVAREENLDSLSVGRRAKLALLIVGALLYVAIRFWSLHGASIMARVGFGLSVWTVYWTQVATPSEKLTWYAIFLGGILFAAFVAWLVHKFAWRAFFPDLVRIDPTHHRGARPERVGRLFRVKPFLAREGEAEVMRHRLYYKHGGRTFPIFRFDYVDVTTPPELVVFGVAQLRVGRFVRDPTGHRFRRVISNERYGSHRLLTEFREGEIVEDRTRKTGIVAPGSTANPRVMRHKFETGGIVDSTHMDEVELTTEETQTRSPRLRDTGGRRTGSDAHASHIDEPDLE